MFRLKIVIINCFQRDVLTAGPDKMEWAVCVPDSCTENDVKLSLERVLMPTFRTRNITVDVVVPSLLYTSKSTILEFTRGVLLVWWACFERSYQADATRFWTIINLFTFYRQCTYRRQRDIGSRRHIIRIVNGPVKARK